MDHDLVYAAGLFDGEGSITLSKRPNGKSRVFRITMASTCKPLLEFMQTKFGGGVYTNVDLRGRKPQHQWHLVGQAGIECLKQIRPFMKETLKCARADIVIAELEPLLGGSGQYKTLREEVAIKILAIK